MTEVRQLIVTVVSSRPDVVTATGMPLVLDWAIGMLRRGGRCAAVGIPTRAIEIPMQRMVLDELELLGCRASAGEMARVIPLVQRGQIRVHELVTHRFGLSEYGQALATLGDRSTGAMKIILVP